MSYEAILPRPRTRRRWPNQWVVFYLLMRLFTLNGLGWNVEKLLGYPIVLAIVWALSFGGFWIWAYRFFNRAYQGARRREEADRPVPPVPTICWAILFFLWVPLNALMWLPGLT